jgi:hypothetical protein
VDSAVCVCVCVCVCVFVCSLSQQFERYAHYPELPFPNVGILRSSLASVRLQFNQLYIPFIGNISINFVRQNKLVCRVNNFPRMDTDTNKKTPNVLSSSLTDKDNAKNVITFDKSHVPRRAIHYFAQWVSIGWLFFYLILPPLLVVLYHVSKLAMTVIIAVIVLSALWPVTHSTQPAWGKRLLCVYERSSQIGVFAYVAMMCLL